MMGLEHCRRWEKRHTSNVFWRVLAICVGSTQYVIIETFCSLGTYFPPGTNLALSVLKHFWIKAVWSSGMYQSHHILRCHSTSINSSLNSFISSSLFSNLICLSKKKAVLIRVKIKLISFLKSYCIVMKTNYKEL